MHRTSCYQRRRWELVRAEVDVIMAGGAGALAAKNATTKIPIVIVGIGEDPVQHGLVSSLSRPGGNITGLVDRYADLIPKRLALLKEAVPSASSTGVGERNYRLRVGTAYRRSAAYSP